ncbi:MAG: type III secretion system outer membrane ring subunit SctC [Hyphomicrobiales bacterium]|nr:type III secretion system outer membrane ring subunit SctC [Hyphomicrobiales bacterium]MCY4033773.1 type III secretion system outer membrane ring subunit SctC [Hyphomicrobiales bacterium]
MKIFGKFFPAAAAFVLAWTATAPVHATLPEQEIYYEARQQPLYEVFQDVSLALDIPVVAVNLPEQTIEGVYQAPDARAFLDQIAQDHGLDWLYDGEKIEVSAQNNRRTERFVFATRFGLEGFRNLILANRPLSGNKLPFAADIETLELETSGPQAWIDALKILYREYAAQEGTGVIPDSNKGVSSEGVMLFRLRNSWAEDKSYTLSDGSSFTIPGVVTLLKELVANGTSTTATPANAPATPDKVFLPLEGAPTKEELKQKMLDAVAPAAAPAAAVPNAQVVSKGPTIIADVRQNAVVIHDDLGLYEHYRQMVEGLDEAGRTVEISAIIVDVAKNRINELGIDWSYSNAGNAFGFGSPGDSLTDSGAIALSLGRGILENAITGGLSGLIAKIRALESSGESRILSLPSVLTLDNLEAVIDSSERFFLPVTAHQDASLYPVTVSTRLRVTPHVIEGENGNDSIQMIIAIQDGAIENNPDQQIMGLPTVRENTINTQAIVEHGKSLLIGGQVHRTETSGATKVPLLGDIPILGSAFRSESTSTREFVRLFLIRPILSAKPQAS